jgi:hypothetical protein
MHVNSSRYSRNVYSNHGKGKQKSHAVADRKANALNHKIQEQQRKRASKTSFKATYNPPANSDIQLQVALLVLNLAQRQ